MTPLTFRIESATVSTPNLREHWTRRAARANRQRKAAKLSTMCVVGGHGAIRMWPRPLTCRLIRRGPRMLDDDNLAGAMKSIRDGIADALELDDGATEFIRWEYAQESGHRGAGQCVVVEIYPAGGK